MIRRDGLAKWLAGQEKRWRCANCGTPHSWWDETCPQCGQAVVSYQTDRAMSENIRLKDVGNLN